MAEVQGILNLQQNKRASSRQKGKTEWVKRTNQDAGSHWVTRSMEGGVTARSFNVLGAHLGKKKKGDRASEGSKSTSEMAQRMKRRGGGSGRQERIRTGNWE